MVAPLPAMSPAPAPAPTPTPAAPTARTPSYLRVVVNARCSLACSYCHQEGDPATAQLDGLPTPTLIAALRVGLRQGVRKLKLLGGEPLLRADLPEVIAALRAEDDALDISLITGGVAPAGRLSACFAAGLSRANLSIHGWSPAAFTARTQRGERAWAQRQGTLDALRAADRPLKVNFVWRGERDDADLAGLLEAMAGAPVLVSVLDDLSQPQLGPADVRAAVTRLRGAPARAWAEPDPHSLPTLRLGWSDGLQVEIKDHALGAVAPWRTCVACPARARCREGIFALRLSHDGWLRPCMDRPDLGVDLRGMLHQHGVGAAAAAWACAVSGWQAPAKIAA